MIVANKTEVRQKNKNKAIGHLIKDLSDAHLSGALQNFTNKVKFLYRPSIMNAIHKGIQDGHTIANRE